MLGPDGGPDTAPTPHSHPGPAVLASGAERGLQGAATTAPGLTRLAPSAAVKSEAEDQVVVLLRRVIERVFTAGLLLDAIPGHAMYGVQPALDELNKALNDIHSAAWSWAARFKHHSVEPGPPPAPRDDERPRNDLDATVVFLGIAARTLDQLAARDSVGDDRTLWMATNDAGHLVRRALIVLGHPPRGHVQPD